MGESSQNILTGGEGGGEEEEAGETNSSNKLAKLIRCISGSEKTPDNFTKKPLKVASKKPISFTDDEANGQVDTLLSIKSLKSIAILSLISTWMGDSSGPPGDVSQQSIRT